MEGQSKSGNLKLSQDMPDDKSIEKKPVRPDDDQSYKGRVFRITIQENQILLIPKTLEKGWTRNYIHKKCLINWSVFADHFIVHREASRKKHSKLKERFK